MSHNEKYLNVKKSDLANLSKEFSKDILDHFKNIRGDDIAFIKIKEYYPEVLKCKEQKENLTAECEEILSQAYAACLDFYGEFRFNLIDDLTGESTSISMKL